MSNPRDEWISNRAYALWEQHGREHGRDQEHWDQASREWEELERVVLPGHVKGGATDHSHADEGTPPEDLQSDTQESPAPSPAPGKKGKSRDITGLAGSGGEKKPKRKAATLSLNMDRKGQAAI